MARLNQIKQSFGLSYENGQTHEGAPVRRLSPEKELRRAVMACLLWEDTFYESGEDIATRIMKLCKEVDSKKVAEIAIEARTKMKLRHAPLLLARELARNAHGAIVGDTIGEVVQRADELAEFMAIYMKDGKQPLSAQVKKGLAKAFPKFDAYQLAKYNRNYEYSLRDVMFMVYPKSEERRELWKQLAEDKLPIPDTWETNLSAGKNKKETFERLISERKLGAMALIRNLRNMDQAGVSDTLISEALAHMKVERVLPFRFITAARYNPRLEPSLEAAMFKCIEGLEKLPGRTKLIIDVSGSMDSGRISEKSEVSAMDAACGLAVLARELCEQVDVYTFSDKFVRIPPRRGFALRDAIAHSQEHSGTYLGQAVTAANNQPGDRLIVFTDEQSHDVVPNPVKKGYMVNVATYEHGVGYGPWTHVDGFSESVLNYIRSREAEVD